MSFSKWSKYTFGDICTKITDGSHASPKSVDTGGMPMASVKDMGAYDFDISSCRKISYEDYLKLVNNGCKPAINDILVAKDGNSYLDSCFVVREEKEIVVLSSVAILSPNVNLVEPKYLNYFLTDKRNRQFIKDNYGSGSAIPRIVLKDIKKIPITLPPIQEQKAITNILSSLDEKIELNNQMNKTLEEMAQALFKRWFVEFEFPNEDGEPYKSSGGEMVDSELGMIPKGWNAKVLYELGDYINGTSFKKDDYTDIGVPIIKIAELKQGVTSATNYFNGVKDRKYYLENKDILFSWSGNPDTSIDIFLWYRGEAILNQHTFKVVPYEGISKTFMYCLLKDFKPTFTEIARNKQTTGLGHVTVKDLQRLKIAYSEIVEKEYDKTMGAIIDKMIENNLLTESLIRTRDILLPKLMSGEIRVTELQN